MGHTHSSPADQQEIGNYEQQNGFYTEQRERLKSAQVQKEVEVIINLYFLLSGQKLVHLRTFGTLLSARNIVSL